MGKISHASRVERKNSLSQKSDVHRNSTREQEKAVYLKNSVCIKIRQKTRVSEKFDTYQNWVIDLAPGRPFFDAETPGGMTQLTFLRY